MKIRGFKFISIISISMCGCALFNNGTPQQIPKTKPPQYLEESNTAPLVIENETATESNTKLSSSLKNGVKNSKPRIEEQRNAGQVQQIKVNNKNLPSYYIYPTQQQNWSRSNTPDQNVSTSNWQISW